ncbi:RNA polymerase sigma factor [Aphanothece sacrum]|uniref:RNA polymerase sigma factor n=1 Tax=Aphanothece sacrum FPU1 TaxID=1920663 RepID=A0A401ILG5_APHSA|nr:RNA polymerase sigma factor [Aphanothece sacrum]GBF82089.1 RNA polymerase sigma factor [Aphanothece sacrum FPU1]GBF85023.1 RNA polymerase, sigma-24 subunit, ECF subfamily [Aphanothece sacrum FPU3]
MTLQLFHVDQETLRQQILLDRIYQGDQSAFWELWNKHKDYLYAYCLRQMKHNTADAQDVLSISLLKAWEKLPKYASHITNIKGWLIRLIHNICIDLYRQKNRKFSTLENGKLIAIIDSNFLGYIFDSPDIIMMREELMIVIHQGIDSLPNNLKLPFILRFIEDKSYEQISQEMNITQPNVRKRIQQARAILKKNLNPYVMGGNYLDCFAKPESNLPSFNDLNRDHFISVTDHSPLIIKEDLEELFYCLYAAHLEISPSPLRREELTYV